MTKYQAHELAKIFPRMDDESFEDLVSDVKANGLMTPIVLYQGMILDGVHRQDACFKAKVEPKYLEFDGDDPLAFVVSNNLKRRHLNESQRAMCAAKLKKVRQVIVKKAKKTPRSGRFQNRKAAKLFCSRNEASSRRQEGKGRVFALGIKPSESENGGSVRHNLAAPTPGRKCPGA